MTGRGRGRGMRRGGGGFSGPPVHSHHEGDSQAHDDNYRAVLNVDLRSKIVRRWVGVCLFLYIIAAV